MSTHAREAKSKGGDVSQFGADEPLDSSLGWWFHKHLKMAGTTKKCPSVLPFPILCYHICLPLQVIMCGTSVGKDLD